MTNRVLFYKGTGAGGYIQSQEENKKEESHDAINALHAFFFF